MFEDKFCQINHLCIRFNNIQIYLLNDELLVKVNLKKGTKPFFSDIKNLHDLIVTLMTIIVKYGLNLIIALIVLLRKR